MSYKNNPFMSPEGKKILEEEYYVNKLSTYAIAEKYHTYPNMIRRALKYFNMDLRSKKDAQNEAYQSGRRNNLSESERGKLSLELYGSDFKSGGRFGKTLDES